MLSHNGLFGSMVVEVSDAKISSVLDLSSSMGLQEFVICTQL